MFDVNSIPRRDEFKFWFIRRGATTTFDVYSNESGNKVGWLEDHLYDQLEFDVESCDRKEVLSDFIRFCNERPEYCVGVKLDEKTIREAGDTIFDRLLAGVMLISNGDKVIAKIESCLNWLHNTDFYTAPASTQYHDAEPRGLCMHTLRVVNKIIDLYALPDFSTVHLHEAIIVAIVHDWCKINFYEPYKRNVKNEQTGAWEQVQSYRYGKPKIPMGHGETSLFIAQKFFKLTLDQALAIRWHMGDPGNSESYNFWDANEAYPLVNMLQFADRLSVAHY